MIIIDKPKQWSRRYAEIFQDQSVVDAYRFRPGYGEATFEILNRLIPAVRPRRILDVGCGTGFLARNLVHLADHVDAVDFSAAAIKTGKALPGGDSPNLHWIASAVEEASYFPPYGLITAGSSLHWMDWDVVLPLFGGLLAHGCFLALVNNIIEPPPWWDNLKPILSRYSMNKDFRPYDNHDLVSKLVKRKLFTQVNAQVTNPQLLRQPVTDYVESFHARNGFSRDRMAAGEAREFDQRLIQLMAPYCPDGIVTLAIKTRVIWGFPEG